VVCRLTNKVESVRQGVIFVLLKVHGCQPYYMEGVDCSASAGQQDESTMGEHETHQGGRHGAIFVTAVVLVRCFVLVIVVMGL